MERKSDMNIKEARKKRRDVRNGEKQRKEKVKPYRRIESNAADNRTQYKKECR